MPWKKFPTCPPAEKRTAGAARVWSQPGRFSTGAALISKSETVAMALESYFRGWGLILREPIQLERLEAMKMAAELPWIRTSPFNSYTSDLEFEYLRTVGSALISSSFNSPSSESEKKKNKKKKSTEINPEIEKSKNEELTNWTTAKIGLENGGEVERHDKPNHNCCCNCIFFQLFPWRICVFHLQVLLYVWRL